MSLYMTDTANNTQNLPLGQKVQNFRKRAGISQLELETLIDAAPGSISRIENGKVNPNKETRLQIINVLKLKDREAIDLMEVLPLHPTEEEIAAARAEAKPLLDNPDVLGYLIDENGTVYDFSTGFKNTLKISPQQFKRMYGKPLLEIALSPEYGVSQYLDLDKNKKTLAVEMVRIWKEAPDLKFSDNKFITSPIFKEVLGLTESVTDEDVLSVRNKKVYFIIQNKRVKMDYSRERLKVNSRFEIFEYHNPTPYE
ncbi:MAG: helix-turn-helix transcriptional regulator [Candidatus Doudnabacteria bacterium]|nr:helix-turn-helix transcriptional regulator [Candidatus Doudnabacteria bacterium]